MATGRFTSHPPTDNLPENLTLFIYGGTSKLQPEPKPKADFTGAIVSNLLLVSLVPTHPTQNYAAPSIEKQRGSV